MSRTLKMLECSLEGHEEIEYFFKKATHDHDLLDIKRGDVIVLAKCNCGAWVICEKIS